MNSILLKPLPYPDADQLVDLHQDAPGAGTLTSTGDGLGVNPSMYFTYAQQNQSFQAMGVWFPNVGSVTGLGEPEQVRVIGVSDGALQALNVQPQLGRLLSSADQVPGAASTVLLSHGYWQRRLVPTRRLPDAN